MSGNHIQLVGPDLGKMLPALVICGEFILREPNAVHLVFVADKGDHVVVGSLTVAAPGGLYGHNRREHQGPDGYGTRPT